MINILSALTEEFNCNHQADVEQKLQQIFERDKEKAQIESFFTYNFKEANSGLMYLCGHPGTGKTSTLNVVIDKLRKDGCDFHLLMFNAMTYKDVKSFMVILLQELLKLQHKERHVKVDQSDEDLSSQIAKAL
jgi:Cdc6-like AAA superfamily ATPase